MQRFLRNLVISALVLITGVALYQVKQLVTAYSVSGVVTSVSSGYLGYSGTSFEIYYVGLAGHSDGDKLRAYLSDSPSSGDFTGKPSIGPITLGAIQPGRTGTINVGTTYENFTGNTLYLHVIVKDFPESTTKGYGIQEITFVASGFGGADRAAIYTSIGASLSGEGIKNNFNLVTNSNVSNFTGLYFAKMSGNDELGRITFYTGLDLTDTGTQNFLSGELPNAIGMEEGQIRFNPGTGFEGKEAELEMNIPDFRESYLDDMDANDFYVREGSGGAITGNTMISDISSGGVCDAGPFGCSIILDVGHFTMFGVKPILTDVTIRSSAGTGAWSGDTVYLSFTGSEALTGVTVTIAGNTVNLQGGGTTRYASGILVTGGTVGNDIPFTINFSDYFSNSGNIVTGTTDASYVKYAIVGPNWNAIYTSIGNSLAASGIYNNFSSVNNNNATGFTNLYFAKMSGSNELGRITFATGLDLTDTGTQNFLQYELPNSIGMDQGEIWFNPGTGFIGKNATLTMNLPNARGSFLSSINANDFIVREGSGGAVTGNSMISNVALSGSCGAGDFGCTLNLDVSHFTSFEIAPFKNITQTKGYDTLQNAINDAATGDIITIMAGAPTVTSLTINKPLTLSGSYSVGNDITLAAKPIVLSGVTTVNFYVVPGGSIKDAGKYVSQYGQIRLTSGVSYTESGISITQSNVNFYGDPSASTITNPAIIDCGGAGTAITLNGNDLHVYGIDFQNCTKDVVISAGSNVFVNYSRIGSMIENLSANNSPSYPNRWGSIAKPVAGTDYSGNISFTPRCGQSTCTTQVNDDATLSNLTLNTGTLSGSFSSGTYTYTVNFPYSWTGTLTATPTKHDTNATTTGNTSLALSTVGSTGTIAITVIASDTTTSGTYTITVTRSPASTDATLSTFAPSTGTLTPTFTSGNLGYSLELPYSFTGTVTITGAKNHAYATITSGNYSVNLPTAGSTGTMFMTVQSESGNTNTYTVNITRTAPSSDGNLSSLTAIGGTLSGTFSSGTYTYTINLAYSYTGSVSITGTKNHAYASITSGNYSVNLPTAGSTGTMFITVTAEDSSTKTYTVTITRSPASTDATLNTLTVSTGSLSPSFSSGTTGYTVNFPYSYNGTVTITGAKNHAYASITSGNYSLVLTTGSVGSLFIALTAEDGITTKTYTVTVTRSPASTDATLNILTVSTGSLSPSFSSGTTSYTVNYPYSFTGTVTITGTKNHAYASIISGTTSLALLTKGSTGTMFISIQAESGNTNTYTVSITRTPASTDANLTSLNISTGSLSPSFSSGTTSYTVQMLYSYIGTITSTPVVSNAYATITGTTSVTLSTAGSTGSLSSTVTAEDGTTTKTYTIGFTRTTPPAVATNSIDGTITVTGGSADLSGATATGTAFTSTGTLHIVGDTTNDYIELSVSGVIITAAGGTRDGVLLAPIDLISGDSNNATTTELGLSSSTNTVLLTVQAGSNTDSLTVTGGYFNLSFVVPGGTAGNVLKLYRSENGSTWTANTPDTTCTLTAGLVCSFRTDHLSYFTTVKETTSGGGGGGGGGSATTYSTGDVTTTGSLSRGSGNIAGSTYPNEWNFAYLYAYDLGITTMKTIQQANMEGTLLRAHMAKMMVNYAIKVLNKYPDTSLACEFDDIANQTTELKNYIKRACQLGLMGQGITSFDPTGEVTRAQFGTVLSRTLYNNQYEGGTPYYINHLNGLKTKGIITNIDPALKEMRAYVMLMLMRANQ